MRPAARARTLVLGLLAVTGCAPAPSLLEDAHVAWVGHAEVAVQNTDENAVENTDASVTLMPVVFGAGPMSICVQTPPARDTSGWQAQLYWRLPGRGTRESTGFEAPARRMASTLCFSLDAPHFPLDAPPPTKRVDLCGTLFDALHDQKEPLPCRSVRLDAARHERHAALTEGFKNAWSNGPADEVVDRLMAVADEARTAGFPLLAARTDLGAVHYLVQEGTSDALATARRRLAGMPAWLDRPEVNALAGQVYFQRARLALAAGWQLARAWDDLRRADEHFVRVADPFRITVPMAQAGVLARLGASDQAVQRLYGALEDCQGDVCNPFFVTQARSNAGFWTLLDPTAQRADVVAAEASLRRALDETPANLPGGRANHLINLGLARVRQGADPSTLIAEARDLLGRETEVGSARARELAGWADLVAGLAALDRDDAPEAQTVCTDLARREPTPRLTAWALDCVAQAHRRRGALADADAAYARLFDYFEYATPEALGQAVTLGPSVRADAFYRAARVAVDQGQPADAWALLDRLDGLSANESDLRACRERLDDPALLDAWKKRDERRAHLSEALLALDGPVSGARRRQRGPIERGLRAELDELARTWPGCMTALPPGVPGAPAAETPSTGTPSTQTPSTQTPSTQTPSSGMMREVRFRAFALADEVVLLRRHADGTVVVDHRTPWARDALQGDLAALTEALERRGSDAVLGDEAWREQAAAVARALIPTAVEGLDGVVTFGLYGMLQGVPLEALPLLDRPGHWLGELIRPVVVPVTTTGRAVTYASGARSRTTAPLFVVDPSRNLPAAAALASYYGQRFPSALQLEGAQATRRALLDALPTASFLHVDAHVVFEPIFPTLSSITMADGPLRAVDLETASLDRSFANLAFANLSSCDSARWPVTADRGRFGFGGWLVRAGVPWVVASRAPLDDAVAGAFNRAFYDAVGRGSSVPTAFGHAMTRVRAGFPAATWGGLQLLRGPEGANAPANHSPHHERAVHRRSPS